MQSYRVQIELNFATQAEAQRIMSVCEPIITTASKKAEEALAEATLIELKHKANEANSIIKELTSTKENIASLLGSSNATIDSMREMSNHGKQLIAGFKQKVDEVSKEMESLGSSLTQNVAEAENTVRVASKYFMEISDLLGQGKALAEALSLFASLVTIDTSIVTGADIKLLKRDFSRPGEKYDVIKGWHYEDTTH